MPRVLMNTYRLQQFITGRENNRPTAEKRKGNTRIELSRKSALMLLLLTGIRPRDLLHPALCDSCHTNDQRQENNTITYVKRRTPREMCL